MRCKLALFFFVAAVLCVGSPASAQLWSGILHPSRAIDWSQAGVTGGIPNRTTICATLYPGATAAQINSAIASCPSGQVVYLNAGTYSIGGITWNGRSNVTLRGAGANLTKLIFTGTDSCVGLWAKICMGTDSDLSYYGPGPPTNSATWSAGYAKGTTGITLSSVTGLSVGMYIWLDQLDDVLPGDDTGSIIVCGGPPCTTEGSTTTGRTNRANRQAVRVTGISGSGPYTVTITPGVYMPNYRAGKSPGAWWGNSGGMSCCNGLEDLSADAATSGIATIVGLVFTRDSWVKGVRLLRAPAPISWVQVHSSAHITVRDSYMYGSDTDTPGTWTVHYGINNFGSTDLLIENNIVQHRTSPLMRNGDMGSVWGYNFVIDDCYGDNCASNWFQASNYTHEAGNALVLDEGNVAVGIKNDIIHGTATLFTYFRNLSWGWETGKATETGPAKIYSRNRYMHFVGNVLGVSAYFTTYQANSNTAIWNFGSDYGTVPSDSRVAATALRWGNWDTVTSTNDNGTNDQTGTRFVASEVPSGDAFYPNAVPGNQTIPPSFYLSSKPAWFGSVPWPPIGPDVAGGNIANVGGHAYKIPAQVCWEGAANDPAYPQDPSGYYVKVFNAASCYGQSGGPVTVPSSPSNVRPQ